MQRDLCDEWLDEVLIQRSSKDESGSGDLSSIFKTASLVVENCLSVATETEASTINTPSLRRVPYDIDSTYISDDHYLWAEKMFTPLFGTPNDDVLCPSSTASADTVRQAIKRTSKKNRVRTNLKITVAYRGLDFCGWEDQRHELYRKKTRGQDTTTTREINGETSSAADQQTMPSVQGTLLDILDPVLNRRADDDDEIESEASLTMKRFQQKRRVNTKPLEIKVAGRTDRGVSAIAQVCRVRTWEDIDDIKTYVKSVVNEDTANGNGGLRITNVESVGGDFHPSFGATCRSYAYLIDLDMDDEKGHSSVDLCESTRPTISRSIVPKLDRMLRAIEGNELDYYAFSHGKVKTQTTLCTLHHARAGIVEWTGDSDDTSLAQKRQALCFELVGNRFLRRMVRILVATALREAYRDDAPRDALLKILSSKGEFRHQVFIYLAFIVSTKFSWQIVNRDREQVHRMD